MKLKIAVLLVFTFFVQIAVGQEDTKLQKEVQVVRPYEPSISDAFKINVQPRIEDTAKVKPSFSYSITARPLLKQFAPKPIKAARMVAEPLQAHKSNYLKLGFGTTLSPLVEFHYGSQRSKEWQYGAWVHHHSSLAHIKLQNEQKVDAPMGLTQAAVFGKRVYKELMLRSALAYNNYSYRYYGHNYLDTNTIATSDKQKQDRIKFLVDFRSVKTDSFSLNYAGTFEYGHLGDGFGMKENKFQLQGGLNKYLKREQFGGEFAVTHFGTNSPLSPRHNTFLMLSPWVNLFGKQWRVQVGFSFNLHFGGTRTNQYFYPRAYMSYNIVSGYVIPYVEIDGFLEQNSYTHLLDENPWVVPGISVTNTSHKMILRGGIKGKFNSQIAYNVLASYSIIDSMHFFRNVSIDTLNPQFNRFDVAYDNVEFTKVVGELTIAPLARLNILLHAEYHHYQLDQQKFAWHKPEYLGYASIRYNLKDKLITTLRIYLEGDKNVLDPSGKPALLKNNFDMNLGIEYLYNRRASIFLNINNLTASKNSNWYLYPTHRFNLHAGVTFSFQ